MFQSNGILQNQNISKAAKLDQSADLFPQLCSPALFLNISQSDGGRISAALKLMMMMMMVMIMMVMI